MAIFQEEHKKVAKIFKVTCFTIMRLWKRAGAARDDDLIKSPIQLKKSKPAGHAPKYNKDHMQNTVKSLPLSDRQNFVISQKKSLFQNPLSTP